jgi:thiosulfate/3-mercaptopyruvate sulfurtransferase
MGSFSGLKWHAGSWLLLLFMVSSLATVVEVRRGEAIPHGGYAHPELLIQPEELRDLIERKVSHIRIIDVRDTPQYLIGHIPWAVQVWRSDIEDKKHLLPGMMAPQTQIEELLGNLGISTGDTIILYSDLYDHARLWWILAYYGFPLHQMKLLDGGIDAWKAKGYPLQIGISVAKKTRFEFSKEAKRITPLLCTLADVRSALKEEKKVVLDVRSKKEFSGEEVKKGATKGGRIPGATWIEWKETIVEEGPYKGYWKAAEEIKKIFSAKEVTPDKDVYIY